MSEKNGNGSFLGVTIPRMKPATDNDDNNAPKSGLLGNHPAAKVARGYVELILGRFDQLNDSLNKKPSRLTRLRAMNTNGGAVATVDVTIDPPAMGADYETLRVATEVGGGAATLCRVYLDDPTNPLAKVDVISDASDYAEDAKYFVPQGRKLIFRFLNVAANSSCYVAIQAREFVNPPSLEVGKA